MRRVTLHCRRSGLLFFYSLHGRFSFPRVTMEMFWLSQWKDFFVLYEEWKLIEAGFAGCNFNWSVQLKASPEIEFSSWTWMEISCEHTRVCLIIGTLNRKTAEPRGGLTSSSHKSIWRRPSSGSPGLMMISVKRWWSSMKDSLIVDSNGGR